MSCAALKRPLDSAELFSPGSRPAKRRRMAARGLFGLGKSASLSPSTAAAASSTSPFHSSARLTPEEMQTRMKYEIRHIRRRRLLDADDTKDLPNASAILNSSGAVSSVNFGEALKSGKGLAKDAPLFTFNQVGLICQRMMQEKEDSLRREYEQVLSTKLAEQYDMFVKFTQDQINRSFQAASAPSYLS